MARDITKLHPNVRKLADKLVLACKKKGLEIAITDCVRSKEEQNGVDASCTNCKYPYSYHNWGIAFDFCRREDVDKDGKISDDAFNDKGNFFYQVGQIGKSLGLTWGGDWKSIIDNPHFEYHGLGTRFQIERKYGTPEKWFASWNFTKPKKTVSKDSAVNDIMWLQTKLNDVLNGSNGFVALTVDGNYGKKTNDAVLTYWSVLGWNKINKFDGTKVGLRTINVLDKNK